MTNRLDSIDPAERIVLEFDFSNDLDALETINSGDVSVSVACVLGADLSPSTVLNGLPTVTSDAKKIRQGVRGGVHGCDYRIKCEVGTTNDKKRPVLAAILPVRNA